jgi:hypothetical protein
MGLLLGILRWIINLLFVIAIVAFLLTTTLAYFTTKENLKPIVQEMGTSQISQSQINELKAGLSLRCQQEGKESFEQYVSEINQLIKINCSNITDEYIKEIFKEQVIGNTFDNLYNQRCEGLCFLENPMLAISSGAHNTLKRYELIMLALVLALGVMLFLVSSGISGRFFAIGTPLIFSGIPYFFMDGAKTQAIKMLPPDAAAIGSNIMNLMIDYLKGIFLAIFAIGAVLVIIGLIIKFTIERKKKKK